MIKLNTKLAAAAALSAALLAGCGGGSGGDSGGFVGNGGGGGVGGGGGGNVPVPKTIESVSVVDFLLKLMANNDENSEPIDINSLTLATDDTADFTPII